MAIPLSDIPEITQTESPQKGAIPLSDVPDTPFNPTDIQKLANRERDLAEKNNISIDVARTFLLQQMQDEHTTKALRTISKDFDLNLPENRQENDTIAPFEYTTGEKVKEVAKAVGRGTLTLAKTPGILLTMYGESIPSARERAEYYKKHGIEERAIGNKVLDEAALFIKDTSMKAGTSIIKFYNGIIEKITPSEETILAQNAPFLEFPVLRTQLAVGESGPTYGAAVATTLLTKNPNLGLALLATTTAAQTYESLRMEGIRPDIAFYGSVLCGSIEAMTEKIPLEMLLKGAGKALLIRALKQGTVESFSELFAEMGQNYVTAFVANYDPKDKASAIKAAQQKWSTIMAGWEDAMAAGFFMGGGAAAFSGAIVSESGQPIDNLQKRPPKLPKAEKKVLEILENTKNKVESIQPETETEKKRQDAPESTQPETPAAVPPAGEPTTPTESAAESGEISPTERARQMVEGIQMEGVEGTGETVERGLSLSIEEQAIEAELTDSFGQLPEYQRVDMKEQSRRANQFLTEQPEKAKRVALGLEPAPAGLYAESVNTALRVKAAAEGDVKTLKELALSPESNRIATILGQRIKMLDTGIADPVRAVKKVIDKRKEKEKGKKGVPTDEKLQELQRRIEETEKKLEAHLAEAKAAGVPAAQFSYTPQTIRPSQSGKKNKAEENEYQRILNRRKFEQEQKKTKETEAETPEKETDLFGQEIEEAAPPQPEESAVEIPEEEAAETPEPIEENVPLLDIGESPIVEVPIEQIKLSEDVPQFKEEADPETGVVKGEELGGKYERFPAPAPIIVWERTDGRLEVITGRHRLDLARRSGEKTIPAQIVKESDGFSKELALTLDAISNIRDGHGKVKDYAHFFKHSNITEKEARQRGLLSRPKGRTGFIIGKLASNDIYAAYAAGKLTEAKAEAIAAAAKGNESVQVAAAARAKSMSAEELYVFTQILLRTKPSDKVKVKQGNLFGFDDSAIVEAEMVSKQVAREQKRIREKINSVKGALKRPDVAREMGLEFGDQKAVEQEVKRLEEEFDALNRTATSPELYRKMLQAAKLADVPRKRRKQKGTAYIPTPQDFTDLAKIATYHIKRVGQNFQEWARRVIADLGQWVEPYLEGEWAKALANVAQDDLNELVKKAVKKTEQGKEFGTVAHKIADFFVRQGIIEREALIDAVHSVLMSVNPNQTRRGTMDDISGYGRFTELNPEDAARILRDLKGQMQQLAKLEDMAAGIPPKKTGMERREMSDAERQLAQKVAEAKKKYNFETTDKARQLKSALDEVKTRLRNQIKDLEQQIATREKIIKERHPVPMDKEAQDLKKRRDALKEQFEKVFGKTQLTDAQRLKIAIEAVKKSIDEYQRRIREMDFSKKQGPKKVSSPELESLREQRDALKEQFEHLKDLQKPKLSPQQIALRRMKTRLKNDIARIQEKIKNRDFAKPEKKQAAALDAEGQRLKEEHDALKQQLAAAQRAKDKITDEEVEKIAELSRDVMQKRQKMENSPRRESDGKPTLEEMEYGVAYVLFQRYLSELTQKSFSEIVVQYLNNPMKFVLDVANITKNIKASIDNSFIGRQGRKVLYRGLMLDKKSLEIWARTFIGSYDAIQKTLFGKDPILLLEAMQVSDPEYQLILKTKTDIHSIEEEMPSRIPGNIPVLGVPFRMADNAFNYSAHYMRYRLAKMYLDIWRKAGRDMSDPKTLEEIGNLVNSMTMRGQIGSKSKEPGLINALFFSPRALMGDINFLIGHFLDPKMSRYAKKQAAINLMRFCLASAAILMIADFIDDDSVTWDTNDANFGSIKIGNTRFKVGGSIPILIIIASRLITGATVNSITGEKKELNTGEYRGRTKLDVVYNFMENKLSPSASLIKDWLKGETREGETIEKWYVAKQLTVPITAETFFETLNAEEAANLLVVMMAEAHGVEVSTYGEKDSKKGKPKSRTF